MDIQVFLLTLIVIYIIRLVINRTALLFVLLVGWVSLLSAAQANSLNSNQIVEIVLYENLYSLNTIEIIKSTFV